MEGRPVGLWYVDEAGREGRNELFGRPVEGRDPGRDRFGREVAEGLV